MVNQSEEVQIEHSREFLERKELNRLDKELAEIKHSFKMQELEFERASTKIFHEQVLERGRIQRAEERKMFMEKRSFSR
jgi:hypothetical protein